MTKISDERLQEMLEASQAVTPGPWLHSRAANRPVDGQSYEIGSPTRGVAGMMYGGDAAYVKLCDPNTIRSILTELQSLRQLNKEQESGYIQPSVLNNAAQPAGVRVKGLDEMVKAVKRIRDASMLWTIRGQIPEAGVFGVIAQDADWLCDQIAALETQEEEAVVPARMRMDGDAAKAITFMLGSADQDDDTPLDAILWVGDLEGDDGKPVHGLHLANAEYPEEGSITLVEFPAHPTPVQKEEEGQTVSEANEALMRERANMISTHREQIERLKRKLDLHEAAISFVRRWAVEKDGNGTSAEERLSVIANHPAFTATLVKP